ncbi:MAG: ABC transporter permease [Butyrivibrio sp.]|nr:ABC transporter permease [Butyrivibrio sp.]
MNRKKRLRLQIIIIAILAGILVLSAAFAGFIAPNDPYATNAKAIRLAPCSEFIFGTDNLGRCVFSRILYGARTTITATFTLVFISFVFGTFIGMICGYFGGFIDRFIMRIVDIVLAFPQMVIAIAVAGILNVGLTGAMIALGITMWTGFARQARSHTYAIRNQPYIWVCHLAGKGNLYIILRHILPNLLWPLLTTALTQIGTTMIGISGLSFLGIGVVPPQAEWGSMINEARAYIQLAPWAVLYPTLAMIITITIFNLLGDKVMEYREA